MNEREQERLETELRRAQPARVPTDFMARLQAAKPAAERPRSAPSQTAPAWVAWWRVLRWAAPSMAAAVAALLVTRNELTPSVLVGPKLQAVSAGLKADHVRVDDELVSSFDVVATLPGGQPVRFRCRQWKDQMVVTDKSRGVEIEENSPRVEVVPVRFETY